jgi:hypothetical protein
LSDRNDALTQLAAEQIIELAHRGYKNSTALHLAAMQEFNCPAETSGNFPSTRYARPKLSDIAEIQTGKPTSKLFLRCLERIAQKLMSPRQSFLSLGQD